MLNIVIAQAQSASGGSGLGGMIFPFLLIGGMFFFMYRSQKKEQKRKQNMLDAVAVGDKIVTLGGIYGTVKNVKDKICMVEIAEKVKIEVDKIGIANVIKPEENK